MCFSAGASFAGGAVLSVIGVACVRKVQKPTQLPFASIPLIFGVQQIAEGFVWLALQSPGSDVALSLPTYIFLLAALVIWPVMIPLSILFLENSEKRKKALKVLLVVGILTALYYGAGLLIFKITPQIRSHHIVYANNYPHVFAMPAFIMYLLATLPPLFISGARKMYILGILIAISCLISGIFYKEYHTSVWCFFAALTSVVIYLIMCDMGKESTRAKGKKE